MQLDHVHVHTAFADSHVWVFDRIARGLSTHLTHADCRAGFPTAHSMRPIGWVPGIVAVVLRPLLGALGAANLVQLLSLSASALAAAVLVRRTTAIEPHTAALLGAAYGLCPTLLGTFATGEISNTQAWILPAFLLAAHHTLTRGLRGLPAVAIVGLAAAFTSPYYALALPFLAGGLALAALRAPAQRLRAGALLATLALSLLPAHPYYSASGGQQGLFRPARVQSVVPIELPHPAPVAQPETLLWHTAPAPGSDVETLHVTALGVVLVAVALFAAVRRRKEPGWGLGLALTVGGAIAALGPVLYAGGILRGFGSQALLLPVSALEALGWPTRQGGLYFRYAVIAELGLVLLAALALKHRRRAPLFAAVLLAFHVAEGVRASGPWSARTRTEVAGRPLLEQLQGTDGAVLELPLQGPTDGWFGQAALLRAVFHGRPTTALPRAIQDRRHPVRTTVDRAFRLPSPDATRDLLRTSGYRLVVLPHTLVPHVQPSMDTLVRTLGTPTAHSGLYVWDLGPTTAVCAD